MLLVVEFSTIFSDVVYENKKWYHKQNNTVWHKGTDMRFVNSILVVRLGCNILIMTITIHYFVLEFYMNESKNFSYVMIIFCGQK